MRLVLNQFQYITPSLNPSIDTDYIFYEIDHFSAWNILNISYAKKNNFTVKIW